MKKFATFRKIGEWLGLVSLVYCFCYFAHFFFKNQPDLKRLKAIEEIEQSISEATPTERAIAGIALIEKQDGSEIPGEIFLKQALYDGEPLALLALGDIYLKGIGVDVDKGKALSLYKASATMGLKEAQLFVGRDLLNGVKFDQDTDLGLFYLKEAAKQKYAEAQYELGNFYSASKNDEEKKMSLPYFELAAHQGHQEARYELAKSYLFGKNGVEIDYKKSFEISKKLCEEGHSISIQMTATNYLLGRGCEKNEAESKRLMALYEEAE